MNLISEFKVRSHFDLLTDFIDLAENKIIDREKDISKNLKNNRDI